MPKRTPFIESSMPIRGKGIAINCKCFMRAVFKTTVQVNHNSEHNQEFYTCPAHKLDMNYLLNIETEL